MHSQKSKSLKSKKLIRKSKKTIKKSIKKIRKNMKGGDIIKKFMVNISLGETVTIENINTDTATLEYLLERVIEKIKNIIYPRSPIFARSDPELMKFIQKPQDMNINNYFSLQINGQDDFINIDDRTLSSLGIDRYHILNLRVKQSGVNTNH